MLLIPPVANGERWCNRKKEIDVGLKKLIPRCDLKTNICVFATMFQIIIYDFIKYSRSHVETYESKKYLFPGKEREKDNTELAFYFFSSTKYSLYQLSPYLRVFSLHCESCSPNDNCFTPNSPRQL